MEKNKFKKIENRKLSLGLQDSNLRLKNVIESTDVGTWEWDIQTDEIILRDLKIPRTQKAAIHSNSDISMRGFKIKATTAHFPKSFYPLGYLISCNGTNIYHAGVTTLLDTFEFFSSILWHLLLVLDGFQLYQHNA